MNKLENIETDETILLKADEVARRLNISQSLAYRLMKSGEIQIVRINSSVRVRPEDLEAYIQRCLVRQ